MIVPSTGPWPESITELAPPALLAKLERLDIASRRVFAGKLQGERRSKRRGQSVEFEDFRNYVPGDDLRRIDWNVLARLDRVFIKIFLEEQDLAFHLVLDASASMGAGRGEALKGLFAARMAMALGYIALSKNDRVLASAFTSDGSLRQLEPVRGRRGAEPLASFLLEHARPEPRRAGAHAGGFTGAMRSLALAQRGRGVMVILSDFLVPEGYEEGLKLISGGGGYETWCVQVLAPGELDPAGELEKGSSGGSAGGDGARALVGDMRLTDVETGRSAEVTLTNETIANYRKALERYIAELQGFCRARGISHLLARSDETVERMATSELRRRGLVR